MFLTTKIYSMTENEYKELKNLIWIECNIPEVFFQKSTEDEKCCFFLYSTGNCRFLFIDSFYEMFTGYLPKEHQKGGLDFWFSRVHPDDKRMLADRILESMKPKDSSFNKEQPSPWILNYRFKKGTGEWIWVQHTVYNLSFDSEDKVDKVLHKLKLLDLFITTVDLTKKVYEVSLNESDNSSGVSRLTKKEIQVLKFVAEGFSSKMIADKLSISINTVESHRRHLLEKLNAKNSMELIKCAFKLFWN